MADSQIRSYPHFYLDDDELMDQAVMRDIEEKCSTPDDVLLNTPDSVLLAES